MLLSGVTIVDSSCTFLQTRTYMNMKHRLHTMICKERESGGESFSYEDRIKLIDLWVQSCCYVAQFKKYDIIELLVYLTIAFANPLFVIELLGRIAGCWKMFS